MEIREGRGSDVLLKITGNNIRKGRGSSVLYNTTDGLSKTQLASILFALRLI